MNELQRFATSVKRLREEKGLTQAQLAVYSGLSPSVICQIEKLRRTPTLTTMLKIATTLEVDVKKLL